LTQLLISVAHNSNVSTHEQELFSEENTQGPSRSMTPAAVERSALANRGARPLACTDWKRIKRTPQAKIIRRALGLTQEEFAARCRIPLGTLRDWEQGRAAPDRPARTYLTVIARGPHEVQQALGN
jgi:putative transcriptional regulator